ncbi:hypothetical protein [Puia dinghuensis]|uniref:Uncharacterized protein n=1 Tax=Puia dinghuensis TaxID=1792502 RepID=A0A8J2UCN0_9BACT|nr:hypothetical protein [Puia dinghuensis]GGA99393.1 hypothetical protein GCM10011511_23390 [Puia dinghuensis]
MGKITTIHQLREAIRDLEHQNYVNEQHMHHRVTELAERLKPANVVKGLFNHFFGGGNEWKNSLLKVVAGIATSFIVKRFFRKGLSTK